MFATLEELREYKAAVIAAKKARLTGVSGSISGGGYSQSFTRSSLAELNAELAMCEDEERNMLGKSVIRSAYITGRKDGLF